MKKALAGTFVAGAMAMTLALVGCGGTRQAAPAPEEPAAQEQTVETTATEETKKEEAVTTTEEKAAPSTTTTTEQQTSQIGEDEAKRIALEDSGVAEQDTTMLYVELDTDDGVTKYEVNFNVGQTEYDYDIDASTGAILEHSVEIDD